MKTKITHLTSAHTRYDTRIFIKMCASLAKKNNYKVFLIVADGKGNENKNNIEIIDVGAKTGGRISRMTRTVSKIFEKAKELDSDIYHLHDPELILIGLKLKMLGKKVIFDAHEDLPKQVMAKHYLNHFVKVPLSKLIGYGEIFLLRKYDYIVGATPMIRDKFLSHNLQAIDINNFPILDELIEIKPTYSTNAICYIGLLYDTRGIREIVQAVEDLDVKLIVAGKFHDEAFAEEIKALRGWEKVDFRGFVDREGIKKILSESMAGLVTLHPTPSYLEAYPVKMFEYMSAGVPVIASNFPLYKQFVEENYCGICVNPLDVKAIKDAINTCTQDKEYVKQMGTNGKIVIVEKYNWTQEEKKLFQIYGELD